MDSLFGFVVIMLIGIVLAYFANKGSEMTKQENEKKQIREKEFTDQVFAIGKNYLNDGVPEIASDIALHKTEKLFTVLDNASWWETRKVVTGYQTSGLTGRIRIAKGLSYRWSSSTITRNTIDQYQKLDTGRLYVTNERFLFRGHGNNKVIPMERVMHIEAGSTGFMIERDSGKGVMIEYKFYSPEQLAATAVTWQLATQK